jgi:peroxiredoxin
MVLITQSGTETLPLGRPMPAFELPGIDGTSVSLASLAASNLVVVNFTCNHCPYAQAYEDRFMDLVRAFSPRGVAFVAISANDAAAYPADSFENMKSRHRARNFNFPYLYDESQAVARAYGAVCTPHLFVGDAGRKLVYEGRIDDNWKDPAAARHHDLRDALEALLDGKAVPSPRTSPMGCSIKWKAAP